ncbi:MAG TPA: PIN domain-containing protein [Candidatus Acidoferrum sp.]
MIVLDANILIRAVLGRRVRQLIDTYAGQGVRFIAPDVAFDDAEKYLPPLLKKRGKPHADSSASLEYLRNITPQHSDWHVQCGLKMRIFSVLASRCDYKSSRDFSQGTSTVV